MPLVLRLEELTPTHRAIVGGKAATLAELARLEPGRVPPAFCVTTLAFDRHLARCDASQSADLRTRIETTPLDPELTDLVTAALHQLGAEAVAVRSSATAEDLPTASFAGQHDSFLGVSGASAVLTHLRRCWASLFSDRAIAYRNARGIAHDQVHMAVVVQRLLAPTTSGVLFTADPLSGNRTITSIEAVAGLGEALVSGHATPDVFTVQHGVVRTRAPTALLSDEQLLELERLGRTLERHFGRPQDIEWAFADGRFQLLQSRPITTLFPVPPATEGPAHVYLSVGHQQMMTEAMRPLGLSFYQLIAGRPMTAIGGRLFVDVTVPLSAPATRQPLVELFGRADPLTRDALETIFARPGFFPPAPTGPSPAPPPRPPPLEADRSIVEALIRRSTDSLTAVARDIRQHSGEALFEFIAHDLGELRRLLADPQNYRAIMAAMESTWWLSDQLHAWLGEANAADALAQAAPHNVSAELGLALLELADALRPHPEVIGFLERATDEGFLDGLAPLRGGPEALAAFTSFLDAHGMRCVGEIDLTRPRWSERPSTLLPILLGHLRHFAPGEAQRRRARGLETARQAELELLSRLRALPDGEAKAIETKQVIDRLRTFIGYREYPKYGMVARFFIYKQALLAEADRLVDAKVIDERTDLFFFSFEELRDVVRQQRADVESVARRKDDFRAFQSLTPPRVLTSEGECLDGTVRRQGLAPNVLAGLGVSSGIVEGRARIVRAFTETTFEPGDILVTTATDPSWTPVFLSISGLVTEVGGLMTHGSVVAREYGLPAVVGVLGATHHIADGQRLRIDGAAGTVELL